jgi:hypothetical protein
LLCRPKINFGFNFQCIKFMWATRGSYGVAQFYNRLKSTKIIQAQIIKLNPIFYWVWQTSSYGLILTALMSRLINSVISETNQYWQWIHIFYQIIWKRTFIKYNNTLINTKITQHTCIWTYMRSFESVTASAFFLTLSTRH